jgi:DNA replication and repair protein RecF
MPPRFRLPWFVRILGVHLQDFRNIALAHLALGGRDAFFRGRNAQGKTALLEACGLLTAVRSFRTTDLRHLVRHEGAGEARVRLVVEHEHEGEAEIELAFRGGRREVQVDGERVRRLQDFVGRFPVIAICSEDLDLLRGGPGERRRFLDLVLAASQGSYYEHLRHYTRLLRERNALLKKGRSGAELAAFDVPLARAGSALVVARREGIAALDADLGELYRVYAPAAETVRLAYQPKLDAEEAETFRAALRRGEERDRAMGSTLVGPHRDELAIQLQGRPARDYGSEGQQRGVVLALKLAAFRGLRRTLGITPVVLADDVLNELDGSRRRLFWEALEDGVQVLATGTEPPRGARPGGWEWWEVEAGTFSAAPKVEG